jgi:hypothetical protein
LRLSVDHNCEHVRPAALVIDAAGALLIADAGNPRGLSPRRVDALVN